MCVSARTVRGNGAETSVAAWRVGVGHGLDGAKWLLTVSVVGWVG